MGFRLGKQREVKTYLEANNIIFDSYDKAVLYNECDLKSRPDFMFDRETHCVVLEIDENAHGNYNESCDCVRMVNIAQACMRPTIFIRYNPDHYFVKGKKMDPRKNARLKLLGEWIKELLELNSEELEKYGYCSMIQLYFNEFNVSSVIPIIINEYEAIGKNE